jgi:hypothetical protein
MDAQTRRQLARVLMPYAVGGRTFGLEQLAQAVQAMEPVVDGAVQRVRDELAQDVTAAYYDGQVAGMEAMGL